MRSTLLNFLLLLLLGAFAGLASAAGPSYPLEVSPDSRRILDADGRSLFFHAESPWHLFARLDREETGLYLDDRQALGFNALLISLIVSDGYHTGDTANAYGQRPFTVAGDFRQPNEAYFEHVDWALAQCAVRGITVFLTPLYMGWGCGPEGWCQDMLAAAPGDLRWFGEWVGNRYRNQPNIVWVHGGDVGAADFDALDELQDVVDGIRATDDVHLNTGHCNRDRSGADCYDLPWLELNTTYSECTQTPQKLFDDWVRQPTRPFVYIEGIYEGEHGVTQRCLRSQAYWAFLGGAVGQFYGHGLIWDFVPNWQDGLDTPGAHSMLYFRKLQLSRAWRLLEPDYDHTSLVGGYGLIDGEGYAAAARAANGSSLIIYVPSLRTVTVAMDRISGDRAMAWWYDPATGSATQIGSYATQGNMDFTSPTTQDWVLVVDDESLQLDPPGQAQIGTPIEQGSFGNLKARFLDLFEPARR